MTVELIACSKCKIPQNPDQFRKHHKQCRSCQNAYHRARNKEMYKDRKDEVQARATEWNRNNPERRREIRAAWKKRNREKVVAYENRRRAAKRNSGGAYTSEEWFALVEREGNCCSCCRRTDVKLQADHVIPLSRGGSNLIENIQPLCGDCNNWKFTKSHDFRLPPDFHAPRSSDRDSDTPQSCGDPAKTPPLASSHGYTD